MKTEHISDALAMLQDDILEETNQLRMQPKKRHPKSLLMKWLATAACLALLVNIGLKHLPRTDLPDLPLLTITEHESEGMGFAGLMAYDVTELVDGNPWREDMNLTTLPVYKNSLAWDENFIPSGVDVEKMTALLSETASLLGIDAASLTPEKDPWSQCLSLETEKVRITVEPELTTYIAFKTPLTVPDEYHYHSYSSYEELTKLAPYLTEQYAYLMPYATPISYISGGDYDIYLNQFYHINYYEAGNNDVETIINYNFNYVRFYASASEDGGISGLRIYQPDLSQKIGDYPLISPQKATELLLAGQYITSVPYEIPGQESIAYISLGYPVSDYDEFLMPYYTFYIDLGDTVDKELGNAPGINTYGIFYVPAIDPYYLTNMPPTKGYFN